MNELHLRTSAPALVLVLEVEAVTRLISTANGSADEDRLGTWLASSLAREQAAAWALLARNARGGAERQRTWTGMLAADGGGIVAAAENLLEELLAAEARAGFHHAGVIERLRRLRPMRFHR